MKKKFKNSKQTVKSWEENFYREGQTTEGFKTKETTKVKRKKNEKTKDKY